MRPLVPGGKGVCSGPWGTSAKPVPASPPWGPGMVCLPFHHGVWTWDSDLGVHRLWVHADQSVPKERSVPCVSGPCGDPGGHAEAALRPPRRNFRGSEFIPPGRGVIFPLLLMQDGSVLREPMRAGITLEALYRQLQRCRCQGHTHP